MPLTWRQRVRKDAGEGVLSFSFSAFSVLALLFGLEAHSDFSPHFFVSTERGTDADGTSSISSNLLTVVAPNFVFRKGIKQQLL
jgi:hypothetical protein